MKLLTSTIAALVALTALVHPAVAADGPVRQVANVNRATLPAFRDDAQGARLGGAVLFGADDGRHGVELWRTDGTGDGTRLVKDISPVFSSRPADLTRLGGTVVFSALGELWRTDGTGDGTRLVKDIRPGPRGSSPTEITRAGDLAFFAAKAPALGRELWVTDGTRAGTHLVRDIGSGSNGSDPQFFTPMEHSVFFVAEDAHGAELWVSNGTRAGTRLVKDVFPGSTGSMDEVNGVTEMAVNGDTLYFAPSGTEGLWRSDGTTPGTTEVAPGSNLRDIRDLVSFGDGVLFTADHPALGRELWRSDGTAAGTQVVNDIALGPASSSAAAPRVVGSTAFFIAQSMSGEWGVWITDGSQLGTTEVRTLPAQPFALTTYNGGILFRVGSDLWRSDGTEAGTSAISGVEPHRGGPWLPSLNGHQLFAGRDVMTGAELWSTDGTGGGTRRVRDVNHRTGRSRARSFLRFDGRTYFSADDRIHGREVWRSRGTPSTTRLLKDAVHGEGDGHAGILAKAGGRLYFTTMRRNSMSFRVWVSDGSRAGTHAIATVNGTLNTSPVQSPWVGVAGKLFLVAKGVLVVSDGTSEGTTVLHSHATAPLARRDDTVFFSGTDDETGEELWKTDGTPAGTRRVRDVNPGVESSRPEGLAVMDGVLYFAATTEDHGRELWRTKGTRAGTRLVKDIDPGEGRSSPGELVRLGDVVVFRAEGELWRTDGTSDGTRLLKDIQPGPRRSGPLSLTRVGRRVFFTADDGEHGRELWRTGGTASSTTLVRDLSGPHEGPFWLTAVAGKLYFRFDDGTHGPEIWVTDGTAGGTRLAADVYPGSKGSGAYLLTAAGRELWFVAVSRWRPGMEPHRLPVNAF